MNCPKCETDMEAIAVDAVTVDRCTRCGGIWLDAGELAALRDMKNPERIDTGDVKAGRLMDKLNAGACPRCRGPLKTKVDVDQHHIHFEYCEACKGMFLDAGEFTDLKSYTLHDYVRGLFKHKTKKA